MPQAAAPPIKKRILFVDDDPSVLSGLRNVLRSQRNQWDMEFALGPDEALAKAQSNSYDVVVSDMRMPRMDGAALLAEIKRIQPKAVRMILTGQTEQESVMKSVFIAHMFLSKPCDPALLRRVVDRACKLNELLNSEDLRAAAGGVEMLPSAPKTYVELNAALLRPNCSAADVGRIIERDVGLCAKILQLVNSAFFGLPRRITSLPEAVSYLGTLTVKNLAMALEAFSAARGKCDLSNAELAALQDHSLMTAQLAKRLGILDKSKADECFLAGILHEVGWLVRVDPKVSEYAVVDRGLLGAYLLGLWGLPHPIIEAVAYFQDPRLLVAHEGIELADAIHLAHHLAHEAAGGSHTDAMDMEYLQRIGIGQAELGRLRAEAARLAGSGGAAD